MTTSLDDPVDRRSLSEQVPVRIAVAGLGRAGMHHIERLSLRDDCQVVAGYDDCPAAARRCAGLVPWLADSWQEVLRSPMVDAVLIASPPTTHAPLALEALAAGKHLLIETPLGMHRAEGEAILAAARRANRGAIVLHSRRWEDDFRRARSCLRAGQLGRPQVIKHISWQYHPADCGAAFNGVDPATSSRSRNNAPHDWRMHRVTGGGALWEFGVHRFDQLLLLADEMPGSLAVERLGPALPDQAEEGFLALARFPSGLHAHIEVHRGSPAPLQTGWIIAGDQGSYANGVHYSTTNEQEIVDVPLETPPADMDELYAQAIRHLRAGTPNPVSLEQGLQTIALIEAAHESLRRGERVMVVPPDALELSRTVFI
ncbi:MAG: Gfo/Idh/MocA family protein [Planctomycetales bacterium]